MFSCHAAPSVHQCRVMLVFRQLSHHEAQVFVPDEMTTTSVRFSASALILSDALLYTAQDIEQVCPSNPQPGPLLVHAHPENNPELH